MENPVNRAVIRNCRNPPAFEIAIVEPPALKNGIVTFGCVSNISRLTNNTIETLGKILKNFLAPACGFKIGGSHKAERDKTYFLDSIM